MTQTVQQAKLEVMALGRQPAKAGTASKAESAEGSFRSSMERAEQNAAAAAKNTNDRAETQAAEQPEELQSAEELAQEQAQPQRFGVEEGTLDGILALWNQQLQQEPDTEELPAGTEEQAALAATLMMQAQQLPAEQQSATQQLELQDASAEAAEGIDALLTAVQDGTAQAQIAVNAQQGEAEAQEGQAGTPQLNIETNGAGNGEAAIGQTENAAAQTAGEQIIHTTEAPQQEAAGAAEPQYPSASFMKPGFDALVDLTMTNNEPMPEAEVRFTLRENIFEQVQTAASTGKNEIYIQLKPESLGGLSIHLMMTEEGIKAQVRTGSEGIQSLINAELAQIEEALRARDIPIVQMEVLYEQPTANDFLDQRRGEWEGREGRGQNAHGAGVMAVEDAGSIYELALGAVPETVMEGEGRVFSA